MVLIGPSGNRSRLGSGCVSGPAGSLASRTSRSTIAMARLLPPLANARQLISLQHVDDPATAHARLEDHEAIRILDHYSNDTRVAPLGPLPHGRQHLVGALRSHHGQQLTLVGHVKRIEAEDLADSPYRLLHQDRLLLQHHADGGLAGD